MRFTESDIHEGEAYVKDDGRMVRLVDTISSDERVLYRSFWLNDGQYDGTSTCSLLTLVKWIGISGRKATPDEVGRLKIESAENAEVRTRNTNVKFWLSEATQEELQAELERRKWKLA